MVNSGPYIDLMGLDDMSEGQPDLVPSNGIIMDQPIGLPVVGQGSKNVLWFYRRFGIAQCAISTTLNIV